MNSENVRNAIIGSAIALVVGILAFLGFQYLIVPVMAWSPSLLITIVLAALTGMGAGAIYSGIVAESYDSDFPAIRAVVIVCIVVLILLAMLVSWIVSWTCFHADASKCRIDITNISSEEFVEKLPSVETDGAYSWIDSDTARKLAARKMGELTDLVSVYTTSNSVTTTVKDGKIVKYVPLEYGDIFKSAKVNAISGYMVIDPVSQKAEYVPYEFVYSPSAYFSKDLMRHLRNNFPSEYFGDYTFQISPEGVPTWVVEVEKLCGSWTIREVYGVVTVNACTGECIKYNLEEAPAWVMSVYGDTAIEYYNAYGDLVNGWWNPSKFGETSTTNNFGYVAIDGDLYYYTGVTSAVVDGGDESNLGVMLYNAHTNKAYYCQLAGAEEYSAMEEAEGVVQNFGYKASFPSLTNVNGELTYVMVLKSDNGVVKQFGMVNYADYTIAVTADSLAQCKSAYAKALANGGKTDTDAPEQDNLVVCVDVVEYIVNGGETTVYIRDINGNVYKAAFDERFLFVQDGATVTLCVIDDSTDIKVVFYGGLVEAETESGTVPEIENVESEVTSE